MSNAFSKEIQILVNILENDYSKEFQFLIDFIGHSTILKYFTTFLGRTKCDIFIPDKNTRSSRNPKVPKNFTGLAFDGAHWKGYENGKLIYESYSKGVQSKGTNNYCQSFAAFMWASTGLKNKKHNIELNPSEYKNNIMEISKLWIKCLKTLNKKQKKVVSRCISELKSGMKLKDLFVILGKLSSDEHYAMEFSCSKE